MLQSLSKKVTKLSGDNRGEYLHDLGVRKAFLTREDSEGEDGHYNNKKKIRTHAYIIIKNFTSKEINKEKILK